jgi:hypothetical protein
MRLQILAVRRGDAAIGTILGTKKSDNSTLTATRTHYSVSAESSSGGKVKTSTQSTQANLCNCVAHLNPAEQE